MAKLPCCQEVGRCWTRGEQVTCMPPPSVNKAANFGFKTQRWHHQKTNWSIWNTVEYSQKLSQGVLHAKYIGVHSEIITGSDPCETQWSAVRNNHRVWSMWNTVEYSQKLSQGLIHVKHSGVQSEIITGCTPCETHWSSLRNNHRVWSMWNTVEYTQK